MDLESSTLEWTAAEQRVLRSKGLMPEQCRKTAEQDISHYLAFTLAEPLTPARVTEALASAQRVVDAGTCLLYTSPSPRDYAASRMPSSA